MLRRVITMVRYSPVPIATTALPIEAKSISHPVATNGSTFICHLREHTEPSDQLNDDSSNTHAPTSGIVPRAARDSNLGQNSTATPPNPSATPTSPRDDIRSPRNTNVSSSKNQI